MQKITYITIQLYVQKKRGEYVMTEEKVHLSVRCPKNLLKDLKIIAIQQDTTVTKIVLDYLEQYVKENKK